MKHLKYLKYIIRHKWFVLLAGLKIGAPLWRLIVHDLSKFYPSEWFPYTFFFYATKEEIAAHEQEMMGICGGVFEALEYGLYYKDKFKIAWNYHQNRNPHHWQAWILKEDSGGEILMPIPRKYLLEMVADWAGAGRAITGKWDVSEWYLANETNIQVRPENRIAIEQILTEHYELEFWRHG